MCHCLPYKVGASGKISELYFFEVCTGVQTMGFKPTDYVDITSVKEQKEMQFIAIQVKTQLIFIKTPIVTMV
jgi:hypothetical protein